MTSNSNPITDILGEASWGDYGYEHTDKLSKAQQALYEAVATKVLACGRMDIPEVGNVIELDEVLTNLSLLFGVADVGGLEKPKGGSK